MLAGMGLLLDSFWRALAYCLHKRVIAWSLLPLLAMALLTWVLGYFFWADAVQRVQNLFDGVGWLHSIWVWLQEHGMSYASEVVASIFVVLGATPVLVVVTLLFAGLFMAPVLTSLVAEKRFAQLEKKHGASTVASVLWSGGSTLIALMALLVTLPLWVFPPLMLVVAPLIWGWLTYRVMSVDALAEHASKAERDSLLQRYRWPLLLMGVICGYIGIAPSVVWASGMVFTIGFVVLVPIAVWIYAITFAFSSLWFIHFCLSALQQQRLESGEPGLSLPMQNAALPGDGQPLGGDSASPK